jgi:S1-C subfamily serine protease
MAESRRSAIFLWLHGAVKLVALAVGLTISVIGIIAVQGHLYEHLWVRLTLAVIALIVVPLTIADKLLPATQTEGSKADAKGLVGDVTAVSWMLVAVTIVALGPSALHESLSAEAALFTELEQPRVAALTRWIARRGAPTSADEPASSDASREDAEKKQVDELAHDEPTQPAEEPANLPADAPLSPPAERVQQTPEQLFETNAPSVVTITVTTLRGTGAGTGFFVDAKGTVATNSHVIHGAESVKIKFYDGTIHDDVTLIAEDPDIDLALLKVKLRDPPPSVTLGDSDAVKVGEQVIVIGNPLGLDHTLTDGLVSSRRLYKRKKFIQMSAPVSPGNSGGPVFNKYGEVVGVTVAKLMMGRGENLNLAVPVNELKTMIASDHASPQSFGASSW